MNPASNLRVVTVSSSAVVANPPLANSTLSMSMGHNAAGARANVVASNRRQWGCVDEETQKPPTRRACGGFCVCSRYRRLPIIRVAVVVQRNRSTGGLAEVRAVVLVLVGRDGVRRRPGLLGGLNLDVAVAVDTGTGRDQLSDDHVLLQTLQFVAAAVDRRIGKHSRGLLERRRRKPRVGSQRRLGDTH